MAESSKSCSQWFPTLMLHTQLIYFHSRTMRATRSSRSFGGQFGFGSRNLASFLKDATKDRSYRMCYNMQRNAKFKGNITRSK